MRTFKDTDYGDWSGKVYQGNIIVSMEKGLTSLDGVPIEVTGDFRIYNCKQLTKIDAFPTKVGGYIRFNGCPITSLVGIPDTINGSFYCDDSNIKNLDGFPSKVKGKAIVGGSYIESLYTGKPTITIDDFFDCTNSPKLKNARQHIIENLIKAKSYYTDEGKFTFEDIEEEFNNYKLKSKVSSKGFRTLLGVK